MPLTLDQNVDAASLLARLIERDPARLGGVPVFRGTRVPVKSLFDHLHAGDSLETFLDDFPGVAREQAQGVIDLAGHQLLDEVHGR
jgi:uncharacterized protein (DUF433 family)